MGFQHHQSKSSGRLPDQDNDKITGARLWVSPKGMKNPRGNVVFPASIERMTLPFFGGESLRKGWGEPRKCGSYNSRFHGHPRNGPPGVPCIRASPPKWFRNLNCACCEKDRALFQGRPRQAVHDILHNQPFAFYKACSEDALRRS